MNAHRVEQLQSYLVDEPDNSFLKLALGLEFFNNNELDKAEKYFNDILQTDPHYTAVYYQLGKLYEQQNRKAEAEKIYEKGVKLTKGSDMKNYRELLTAYQNLMLDE
jgi:Tfp pilus assembly protein PilF